MIALLFLTLFFGFYACLGIWLLYKGIASVFAGSGSRSCHTSHQATSPFSGVIGNDLRQLRKPGGHIENVAIK